MPKITDGRPMKISRTYKFHPETIEAIEHMAQIEGRKPNQIVEAAVAYFYKRFDKQMDFVDGKIIKRVSERFPKTNENEQKGDEKNVDQTIKP